MQSTSKHMSRTGDVTIENYTQNIVVAVGAVAGVVVTSVFY